MELYDKLTSMMIAFLISVTGVAVSMLGILTALERNLIGCTELVFGVLFFVCGLDLIMDTRLQNPYGLQDSPSGIFVELPSYDPKWTNLNKKKANDLLCANTTNSLRFKATAKTKFH